MLTLADAVGGAAISRFWAGSGGAAKNAAKARLNADNVCLRMLPLSDRACPL
jgi:hypothetical protein